MLVTSTAGERARAIHRLGAAPSNSKRAGAAPGKQGDRPLAAIMTTAMPVVAVVLVAILVAAASVTHGGDGYGDQSMALTRRRDVVTP
jgi:hypothetical protein